MQAALHKNAKGIFFAVPFALAVAGFTDTFLARLAAATVVTVYHVIETSATNRHGE